MLNESDIVELTWDEVLPNWRDCLWPNRQSLIEQHSAMQYLGGYTQYCYRNPVHFWGFKKDNKILGLISGFKTTPKLYRSRGMWISPDNKETNLSNLLFSKNEKTARLQKCTGIWACPNEIELPIYLNYGFEKTSDWTNEFEFGPQCYVYKAL